MISETHIEKPIIGILANIEIMNKELFLGCEKSSLNYDYIQSIMQTGGIPIILPVAQDKQLIEMQMNLIDGILLTGGDDVHSLLYGEEPHPSLGYINPKRDQFELDSIAIAYAQKKPILGICRGAQIINVAFGGTLYQDLSQISNKDSIKHAQNAPLYVASHTIEILPSTKLHEIFGQTHLQTNTFHHQAVKDLAKDFIINAKTKDGVIEGIEKNNYPFLMGVQWHPERMIHHDPKMLKLFNTFINQAKIYKMSHSI